MWEKTATTAFTRIQDVRPEFMGTPCPPDYSGGLFNWFLPQFRPPTFDAAPAQIPVADLAEPQQGPAPTPTPARWALDLALSAGPGFDPGPADGADHA